MTATRIDGKAFAATLTESLRDQCKALVEQGGQAPGLSVVLVGEDPASQVYVRNKKKTAESCGFVSTQHTLPANVSEAEVLALIRNLNDAPAVHGILVQLPLPAHLDEQRITQSIEPGKDVDGFHYVNVGRLSAGHLEAAFVPCTPAGCMLLIEQELGKDLSGLRAVVVGRSNIVGKPMANLLLQANATVTIAHSRTRDLPALCREADLLVAAVGRPNFVRGDWVKPGAVVIDVGINRVLPEGAEKAQLVGDVHFAEASAHARAITPVPGGVGPMTIALLMSNTLLSAQRAAKPSS